MTLLKAVLRICITLTGDPVADPDPACHFDAVPDPDSNPTFHYDAVPDPDPVPSFEKKAQNLMKVLK
jgi:hypothetical protein